MDDGKDESLHVAPNKPAYSSARTGLKHRAGVVSAGHAKMLNTVKDKNRGSQSDRARPSVPMFSTVSPNIVAIYQGLVG